MEHAAQDPFAVTRDDAAEVDEIRELGRTLGDAFAVLSLHPWSL